MFCKKCGQQNPDDAKFCMSCGTAMAVVQELTMQKIETNAVLVDTLKNKPNAFQKILLLISLVWFIVALFYIPYKEDGEIVYDVLWADRSEKIDLLRLLLQFALLFLATFFLYRYLHRYSNLEKQRYKKLAKRELILFFIFVFSVFVCGLYLFGVNFINKKRDQKLAEQIPPIEQQIEQNSKKRKIRSAFWDEALTVYHLREFDKKINRYWDFLVLNTEDPNWLISFYDSFKKRERKYFYEDFERKYYWDEYNSLNTRFGLDNPFKLRSFIKENALTEDDFRKDEVNKVLSEQLNKLQTEKTQLTFYGNKEIRRISLITLFIVFAALYLLRPLLWFVKGLFTEIK